MSGAVMRGYVPTLLLLAAIWGASFMFIKVAVEELEPATAMAIRLLLSAPPLFLLLAWRRGPRGAVRDIRGVARAGAVLGIVNSAIPFTLIAWGETHIDSGVAAIANASVPIFVALLALHYRESERVTGTRLVGVVLGLGGVGVVVGVHPEGGWWGAAGALACAAAAFLYAVGALYAQTNVERTDPLVVVATATLAGGLFLLPLAVVQAPTELPSLEATGSLLALSLLGTVVGLLLYYHLIGAHGSLRASLVVYLVPVTALLYGALLLDEKLSAPALAGLVLILAGVALGSGVARLRRREPAPVPAP
ncbi:MAG: DMT family transporter [Gaiellaceae bacterium]